MRLYSLHVGDVLVNLVDLPSRAIKEVRETTARETVDDFFTSLQLQQVRSEDKNVA